MGAAREVVNPDGSKSLVRITPKVTTGKPKTPSSTRKTAPKQTKFDPAIMAELHQQSLQPLSRDPVFHAEIARMSADTRNYPNFAKVAQKLGHAANPYGQGK
jgi:hypothetical protein